MCECENIRSPGPFAGGRDFDSFSAKLKAEPLLIPVPVKIPYSTVGLLERWYQCSRCSIVWRLVEPDPPFPGLWGRVET